MSTTSKSPRKVLEVAHLVGSCSLSRYSHECSPKKFTQPQLFACLVLKEFLRLDYRKLAALLSDARDLRAVIGLDRVPHFTTFQKAAERLLVSSSAQRLLNRTLELAKVVGRLSPRVALAAGDGTGFESRHVSHYYVRRRASASKHWQRTTYATFPKAGVLCDTASHFILSVVPARGPSPDIVHARKLLERGLAAVPIEAVALDAGYDAEHLHRFAREQCGVRSLIPAKIGRPTAKRPSGYWRRQMASHLSRTRYTQRWQVETVNSMLKRLLGSALRARHYWSQCRETTLRAITHNVMILKRNRVFYRAGRVPFSIIAMSLQVEEFDKRKPFIEWIKRTNDASKTPGGGRSLLFVGYNVYAWRLIVGVANTGDAPPWARESFSLPVQIRAANEIWNRIHEEHLCLFFKLDREVERILVAVRNGIWASLDDRFMPFEKDKFVEINHEEARSLVGNRADWSGIVAEVQAFGVSCRVIVPGTNH